MADYRKMYTILCTAIDEVIDPSVIKKVYKDAKIDEDGYHYSRREAGGKKSVRKIAYGIIEE